MENNLPKNSLQYQAYILSKEFNKIELEFSEKFKKLIDDTFKNIPKDNIKIYKWKLEDGTEI